MFEADLKKDWNAEDQGQRNVRLPSRVDSPSELGNEAMQSKVQTLLKAST